MVDLYQLGADLALKRVETALQENRHPLPDDLELVLRCAKATPPVQLYLADNFERKPPSGRPKLSAGAINVRSWYAIAYIRDEHAKARKNGVNITLTEAVEKVAKRGMAGFGKSSLWEAVRHHKKMHDEDIF